MSDSYAEAPQFRARWHVLVFFTACAIIVSRRPDAIFHAQFFAEDGAIWFAEAYNWGAWKALFFSYNGYIAAVPRLAAATALLFPLKLAPLILNSIAIAFEALPVNLLLSGRSAAWGTLRFRVMLVALYLVLPNTAEMIGTITETQWMLALSAFIILAAKPPSSTSAKVFDSIILVLCSFTGPFCFAFLLMSLFLNKERRALWQSSATRIFLLGSLVQASVLVLHHASRHSAPLGPSFRSLIDILSCQIFLGALLGSNELFFKFSFTTLCIIVIMGSTIYFTAARSSRIMRLLLFLSISVFFASLADPITPPIPGATAWDILARALGAHYWFLPMLAFVWSIALCFSHRLQIFQIVGGSMLFLMAVGVLRNFRYPPFPNQQFAQHVSRLESMPKGAEIIIPEFPQGWTVQLVKR